MSDTDPNKILKLLGWALHGTGLVVAVGIVNVVLLTAVAPLESKRASSLDEADSLDELLSTADEVRANHRRFTDQLAELRRQKQSLQRRIPDEPQEAEFLAQVSQLANQSGLHVSDFRPGPATARQGYGAMNVELVCEGDYASICYFLDRLATLPRLARIQYLEVSTPSRGGAYPVHMTLAIYYGNTGTAAAVREGSRRV